jgi:dihydroxyacetone kinase
MDLNKKYFGMTIMQLGILVALAGLALVLFCVVGYLVLGKATGSSVTLPPTATATIQPTVTMVLTPTPTTTPAATPMPYESLIPAGWAQYRTALIEIWMPPGYKATKTTVVLVTGLGGSPIMDLSVIGSTSKKAPNKIYMTVSYDR